MEKTQNQINLENMKERMKGIEKKFNSSSMCTAKWLQLTLYLQNGYNHSCHHPSPHKIPVEEVLKDPRALHNSQYKMKQRTAMLNNKRPSECEYCWNIEDLPGENISDRTYKSSDTSWSMPYINDVLKAKDTNFINPSYLEVSFENTCNFKCAYCSPEISSKWMEEIKQHGHYPTTWGTGNLSWLEQTGRMPIPHREENPYIDAFWKWWPDLYPSLNTFRITGGEPLLSKNTWRVLEYIKNNPRKELNLAINSNLDVPDNLIDKLISYYKEIRPNINSFELYTSAEAYGKQSEYIRFGMHYNKFMTNVKKILNLTDARINFMITFNILSVTSFTEFLDDIILLRHEFNSDDSDNRIPIMVAYLRWPRFLDVRLLPIEYKEKFKNKLTKYYKNWTRETWRERRKTAIKEGLEFKEAGRFYLEEIDQFDRLLGYMNTDHEDRELEIGNFKSFIKEYDKRKDLNFNEIFPELSFLLD